MAGLGKRFLKAFPRHAQFRSPLPGHSGLVPQVKTPDAPWNHWLRFRLSPAPGTGLMPCDVVMVTRSPEWPWMWVSPHPGPIHQGLGTGRLQNWHRQDSDTCQSAQAICQQPRWFPTAGCHWMPWGLPLELGSLHLLLPGGPPEPAEMQGGDQTTIQQSAAVCCALGGSFYPPWEAGTGISVPSLELL